MSKKTFQYLLSFFLLPVSLISWWSVDRAINVENSSVWLVPIGWFSLFIIILALSFVLIKDSRILNILIAVSFLSSFFFSLDWSRILFFLIALLFLFIAERRIKKDLFLNIKIDLGKSIGVGRTLLIVALAITISSQYYSEIKDRGLSVKVPKLEMSKAMGNVTPQILSALNPQYKELNNGDTTVDQFIWETQKTQVGGYLENIVPSDEILEINRNGILEQGRQQFAELAGMPITGSEKISDIFTTIANKKIDEFFAGSFKSEVNSSFFPVILSLILFFTIVSLGGFIYRILIWIIILIFKLLVKYRVVAVNRVVMEVERIN